MIDPPVRLPLDPEQSEIVADLPQPVVADIEPDPDRPGRFLLTLTHAEP